ncbi:MAG: DEAD/DEAH box helicase [Bradymonadia bacterium]
MQSRRAIELLDAWARDPQKGEPFVARRAEPEQPAEITPWPDWLPEQLIRALERRGISGLYRHQRQAIQAVHEGADVVVATPTASGKSLIYTLPILTALMTDPGARALIICPTKALAHDQAVAFNALAEACGLMVAAETYDGDTPRDARRRIREQGRVIITNPDMLHSGILPRHDRWRGLFAGLRHVVIDESHVYRGVFGSHVANVIRRLRRVTAFHETDPRYVLCSATIANPRAHAEALLEGPVFPVLRSTGPTAGRALYIYRPPMVDAERGIRASYLQAARRVTLALHEARVPTIVFADSRARVEQLVKLLKTDVEALGLDPESVAGYRGGYLPELRRQVEAGLRSGQIRTVVSTSALELGVDIGQLEACVLAGYPGTIASALQRAGRVGRSGVPGAVVLIARSAPVDQYIAGHPEFFFEGAPEQARLDADNLLILADHLKCAAFELPIPRGAAFGRCAAEDVEEILGFLADHRVVYPGADRYQWTGEDYPARGVSLRRMADGGVMVVHGGGPRGGDRGKPLGEVEFHRAPSTLHLGAIYTIYGKTYEITALDLQGRHAEAIPTDVDWYTEAHADRDVSVLETHAVRPMGVMEAGRGELKLTEQVIGFKRVRFSTGEVVGRGDVHLDPRTLHTTGFWLRPAGSQPLPPGEVPMALAGVAEALRATAAVHLMCDPADLGVETVSPLSHDGMTPATPDPWIFVYERQPGGVGLYDALFEVAPQVLEASAALLAACPCADGCPACTGGPDRSRSQSLSLLNTILKASSGEPHHGQ